MRKVRWTERMRQVLRERYAEEDNDVLAEELGVSQKAVFSQAQNMGLHKSAEYKSRLCRRIAIESNNAARLNTPTAIERRVESRSKQLRMERARILFGLEQKTRVHLRVESRARLLQRNRLQRLGYVVDEKALVAYWTPETHRATRLERLKRGEKKGSLKCWYDFAELKEK